MALDPLAKGIIYLFFNGRLTQVKMLQFDGDGQALYYKRLARSTFGKPVYDPGYQAMMASYALQEIAKLYAIEQACQEEQLNEEQIKDRRKKESLPILKALGDWMKIEYQQLRPKSLIAQAFAYSIKRWEKLSLYAHTGNLMIHNNAIEKCIRNVAVGRKNYLFCGSHDAAQRTGLLYSLLVTCKLNNVNPYNWLKGKLTTNPVLVI